MQVRCKSLPALLHVNRYESGSKGKCIQVQPPQTLEEEWLTPNEYEQMSGSEAKDYLSSIECLGRPLKDYVDGGELRGSGPPPPALPFSRLAKVVRRQEGPSPKSLDLDENFKP